jgi:hypothetical protein
LGEGDLPLDDFLDAVMNGEQPPQLFIENWVISNQKKSAAQDSKTLAGNRVTVISR